MHDSDPTQRLHYIVGDALDDQGQLPAVICHCCNDIGAWGTGFVMAISRKWPEPEQDYRQQCAAGKPALGTVRLIEVSDGLWVANIIGQRGIRNTENPTPVSYGAIHLGLERVVTWLDREAQGRPYYLQMPRIGCGLAGGKWQHIKSILLTLLYEYPDLQVYVVDLP